LDKRLEGISLEDKVILEVGCGRGGTTRELVNLLSKHPGTTLFATDISDQHFDQLREEFSGLPVEVRFIQTDACALEGIQAEAIDIIVCNYTLCAINAQNGLALLALGRFCEVLKPGGYLFVEEEMPITCATNPAEMIWSTKWRILRAAQLLANSPQYSEFQPKTLAEMCKITGFDQIEWQTDITLFQEENVLDFFHKRLNGLIPQLPNDALQMGFKEAAAKLDKEASQAGGMDIPFYRLSARKTRKD
jgi:ubiquinone/menaquinone biosynthesis C-methylase UbiE